MASLLNKSVGTTYKDLLTVLGDTSGQGLEPTQKRVFDGEGTGSPLYLGTNSITVGGATTINGDTNITGDLGITGTTTMTGNATVSGNLSVGGNLSYSGTISGSGLSGDTLSGTSVISQQYKFASGSSQIIALSYSSTHSSMVIEQNVRTKGSMTFIKTGYDDLVISAETGAFEKGDGTKGKIALGDSTVTLKKGTTDLLTANEDGTIRMQSVSSEPSSPSSGDMVNIDGTIYIAT